MSSGSHQIRLRGPWQLEARADSDSNKRAQWALNVRSPADWIPAISGTQPSDSRTFVLTRRFNWTFPDPPPQSIELTITDVCVSGMVHLNDSRVGHLSAECDTAAFQVDSQLQPHNTLCIEFQWSPFVSDTPIGEVFLRIS